MKNSANSPQTQANAILTLCLLGNVSEKGVFSYSFEAEKKR